MKASSIIKLVLFALMLAILASCVDDDINLNDIDTTAEVKVVDLTLPVNLDDITLKSLITLDDGSEIKEINGEYVYTHEGSFASDNISISAIVLGAPYMAPNYTTFAIPEAVSGILNSAANPTTVSANVPEVTASFETNISDVSADIRAIDAVKVDFAITMKFAISGFDALSKYSYKDLRIQLPKGMACTPDKGSFDAATGIYSLASQTVTGNSFSVTFNVSEIDVAASKLAFDADAHTIKFADEVKLLSCVFEFSTADVASGASIPSAITMVNTYTSTQITVKSFTGRIKYAPQNLSPESFTIGDLPDVLTQDGTDLGIANPQIYLSIRNPLYGYNLSADVAFDVMTRRDSEAWSTFSLDDGSFVLNGGVAESRYCLSPTAPATMPDGYDGAQHVKFTSLSEAFRGAGLPDEVRVDVDNSVVPEQTVTDFLLGQNMGVIEGKYLFYAPLQLQSGSKIIYSDIVDGWNDDDVDKIVISKIALTANVTSDCPIALQFDVYPIDKNGNRISGVDIECSQVSANAQNEPLTATLTGVVEHLDGVEFVATAEAADGATLSPSMTIKVSSLKVKVSGSYCTEL